MISKTTSTKFVILLWVKSLLRFQRIGNSEIYSQVVKELQAIGNDLSGSYSLMKYSTNQENVELKNTTIIKKLRIILGIISIRGLPRFVTQISLIDQPQYQNLFFKSRLQILICIGLNYRKILKSIENFEILKIGIDAIPGKRIQAPYFPWDQGKAKNWSKKEFFIIPNYAKMHFIKVRLQSKSGKKSFLKKVNNYSPKILWKLLNEIDQSLTLLSKLGSEFPVLHDYYSRYKKLDVIFDSNAHLTIDEVFENPEPIRNIKNAEIWHAVHIVKDNAWIIRDITEHPKQKFVAGHSQFVNKTNEDAILTIPSGGVRQIESGFLLTKRCDDNWYHFIFDLLPQVVFMNHIPRNSKIIVRGDLPHTAKLMLNHLGLNVMFISPDSRILVKSLYYIPHRSSIFDTPVRSGSFPRIKFPEQAILELRDKLGQLVFTNKKPFNPTDIFVQRLGTYRNCRNMAALDGLLMKQGFKKIDVNKKYYANQFVLFQNCNSAVISGGALVANIIFMKKQTSMIVLGSWRSARLGIWRELGRILGVSVKETKGIPTNFARDYSRRLHSDYFVPRWLLKHYLKR